MKLTKLLLLAFVLIGGISGIVYLNSQTPTIDEPEYGNPQANEWKNKIKALCKEDAWSVSGYTSIESGIHTDRVTSKGELITTDEENSLQAFLFASSCNYLKESADKLFKQSSYPTDKLNKLEGALELLRGKVSEFDANSNLTEASNMFNAYHQVMGMLSFGATASYSRPLKAYSGGSADGRKARIQGIPYYKSHFSNNSSIRSKVESIDADMKRAEEHYYSNLEQLVEKHYKSTGRIEELLEDQIRFDEISTNSSAKSKLKNFVNNPYN